METYIRGVLFRLAGAIAGAAVWLGLIVLALANFDTQVPFVEDLEATWLFWLVALVVVVAVFLIRRRLDAGPGWGAFAIGFLAPLVGLFANARVGDGGGTWLWIPILVILLVPLPSLSRTATT